MYKLLIRKIISIIGTTVILSALLSTYAVLSDPGSDFLSSFVICLFYSGVIIFVYGNICSLLIEYCFHKKPTYKNNHFLFVVLHTIFGFATVVVFGWTPFTFYSTLAALLFALIDRLVWKNYK